MASDVRGLRMHIGCMVWRIGAIVDFWQQLDWLRRHGFAAVSFWTQPGQKGEWEGFDALSAAPAMLERLSRTLSDFERVDLHAAATLRSPGNAGGDCAEELQRTVEFAGEIRADVVTVHDGGEGAAIMGAQEPGAASERRLHERLTTLNAAAEKHGVRIGLELTSHYGLARRAEWPHVGFTLDTGHLCFDGGAGYRQFGSIPALIEYMAERIFYVHVHDYDGCSDHLALGAGCIDFAAIVAALRRIGYRGVLCLEPNPDRVAPEETLAGRDVLLALLE